MNKNRFEEPKKKPVIICILKERDFLGKETGKTYGQIDFWDANKGWYDSKVFHKVVNSKFVPNEIGQKVSIKYSRGGGSAFLEFNPEKINEVISALKEAGYKTEISTEEK